MKKKIYVVMGGLLLSATVAVAQQKVKDGTISSGSLADANAVLEVESSNKGLLLPRLALTGTASASPLSAHTAGMTVYNTATAGDVMPGYYYNDGSKWVRIADAATNTEPWYNTVTNTGATSNTDSVYMMGKVGIGTTAPQRSLHIVSPAEGAVPGWNYATTGTRDAILLENNNNVNIGFIGTATTGLKFYKGSAVIGDMGYLLYDRPSRMLNLGTDYLRRTSDVTIDSMGNVGIGTTAPTAALEVVSPNYPPIQSVRTTSIIDTVKGTMKLLHKTSGDMIDGFGNRLDFNFADNSGEFPVGHIGVIRNGADNSADLTFWTVNGGVEDRTMVITKDKHVGIGTTAPTAALEVVSPNYPPMQSVRTSAATNTLLATAKFLHKTTGDMADGFGNRIDFSIADAGGEFEIGHIGAVRNGADNSGDLNFWTVNGGAQDRSMVITKDKNVGIGTTAPTHKLVVSSASALPSYAPNANFLARFINEGFGASIAAETYSNTSVSGLLCLRSRGTTSAPAALQANDKIMLLLGRGNDGSAINDAARIEFVASEGWSTAAHGTDITFHSTAAGSATLPTESMRIKNNNLGINTTTPNAKLHVIKAASDLTPAVLEGCQDYANNAAAVAAGLPVGALYRTGDTLKIVH